MSHLAHVALLRFYSPKCRLEWLKQLVPPLRNWDFGPNPRRDSGFFVLPYIRQDKVVLRNLYRFGLGRYLSA